MTLSVDFHLVTDSELRDLWDAYCRDFLVLNECSMHTPYPFARKVVELARKLEVVT